MRLSQKTSPDSLQAANVSFDELLPMLCGNWYLVLIALMLALGAATIYLAVAPGRYEAVLTVKIGRVGLAEGLQQIEATGEAIARMREPEFESAVIRSVGWKGDEREHLFKNTYQVTSSSDKYLTIRLQSFSQADAKRAVEASFTALADIHRELQVTILAKRGHELARIVNDIADAEAFLNRIGPIGKEISPNDRELIMRWLQLVKDEKSRLRSLRVMESTLRESMRPELIVLTRIIDSVVVSDEPIYPRARRVWIFSVISGFFVGVFLISMRVLIGIEKKKPYSAT